MESPFLHDLNFVPLQSAVLCADCEVITESHSGMCRICGGRALLSLGRVLGGPLGDQRAVLLDPADADVTRLVEELIESAYRPLEIEDDLGFEDDPPGSARLRKSRNEPDEETAA